MKHEMDKPMKDMPMPKRMPKLMPKPPKQMPHPKRRMTP